MTKAEKKDTAAILDVLESGRFSAITSRSRSGQVVTWCRLGCGQWVDRTDTTRNTHWIARCVAFRTAGGGRHFWHIAGEVR